VKQWRERRRVSQLGLATEAGISARHLSFVETGRARPSYDMVLHLSQALDVPPRGRNELLTAAGYAPLYRETPLDAPEMAQVKQALGFMLRQQEPYPAMVLDRRWNIVTTNDAMGRVVGLLLGGEAAAAGAPNAMRLCFHPRGLRPAIVNWDATAAALIQWLHRDLIRTGDVEVGGLLDELLAYPGVPRDWQALDLDAPTAPFLAIEMRRGDARFSFFTLLASLGTPYDLTLHELRIECFFPADASTEAALRRLNPPPRS
jgi:transcriptional regulator with XRE-family HTH domain